MGKHWSRLSLSPPHTQVSTLLAGHRMSKVSINTQKIVEDLSVLGSMVVASSEVAEKNIKTLLRELETKRGDRDANALADATAKAAAVHTTIAPACVGLAETHLGPLDDALQAVIAMVHTQVGLE